MPAQRSFVDGTAGRLGEAAAVLGAALAGVDGDRRDSFARFGRECGTARQVRRSLESKPVAVRVGPLVDERRLRDHAERRRDEAHRALRSLRTNRTSPSVVNVDTTLLRTLVERFDASAERDRPSGGDDSTE